jgi:hypothetical protein
MEVGVATSLSIVDGVKGVGVGDNDGECNGTEGGREGSSCSTLGLGVDKAVTGVGVDGETDDRGCSGDNTSGSGRGGKGCWTGYGGECRG